MKKLQVDEKIYNTIYSELNHNMLSHAYFIETGDYSDVEGMINRIIKILLCPTHGCHEKENCTICHLIDSNQCSDLKVVHPKGTVIKKEQLLEIKKSFKTTSASLYRIYIIYDADKLNAASANTILKFLEEPEKGIVAFLVAKNRYQVLETLISRCQILSVQDMTETIFDDKVIDFVQMVTQNTDFYLDFKEILEVYLPDKESAKILFDDVENYFHKLLIFNLHQDIELNGAELFTNISKDSIIKYISILEEEKKKLLYNVNYRLWVNHLLVRFLEVKKC